MSRPRRLPDAAKPDSPTPLYQQVKDHILSHIASGSWPPGRKIPSENQLVRSLAVSRMTVNRALRELARDGHLQRVAGVGSFVSEPPRHASLIELRNIAEEIAADGGQHSVELCWRQAELAEPEIAERMEIQPGTKVFHLTLVHRRNELPIQLEDRWVSPVLVPDFLDVDFTVTTPSEYLLSTLRPDEMEHIVQAVRPDDNVCELLAMAATEPCLRLERRTWHAGRVVTYAQLTYPSSRYDLGARYALSHDSGRDTVSLLPGGYRRKPLARPPRPADSARNRS